MRGLVTQANLGNFDIAMYTSGYEWKRRVEALKILYVMDLPSRQSCEECTLRDAVGVEVRKSGHGYCKDRV